MREARQERTDRPRPRPRSDERLARLWEEHMSAPFPAGWRGTDIAGLDLVLVDADVAGLVRTELDGGIDDADVATLWARAAVLDKIVPLIDEEYCAAYFARLRAMARLAAAPHVPAAT
ncbi:hypothetical protein ACFZCL_00070 [Streptomyces sp. NPDC008159]|uniref:hypothetical protein n=1 Tax=Streptomyces sp. NPDC008159 TaxID=3364817 RepID=UPI0036E3EF4F